MQLTDEILAEIVDSVKTSQPSKITNKKSNKTVKKEKTTNTSKKSNKTSDNKINDNNIESLKASKKIKNTQSSKSSKIVKNALPPVVNDQRDGALIAPPKYRKGSMRIVPLGGLGEIGRNMNVIEYNGHILLIDCGVLFPEEEQPGVDLILPDFHYIQNRLDKVDALVLTHGHEDHIGGVPYLLKMRPDIPLI